MRQLLKKTSGLLLKLFNKLDDAAIGKILSPHGLGGTVKVYPYTDYPDRIKYLKEVDLVSQSERSVMIIENAVSSGRFWLIKFRGIESREDAERIRDMLIVIAKKERLPLEEGSYYHDQLIGLNVYTHDGELLGIVSDLISTGGHDLLQVSGEFSGSEKIFIPMVKNIIVVVDLQQGIIKVRLPDGLLDL